MGLSSGEWENQAGGTIRIPWSPSGAVHVHVHRRPLCSCCNQSPSAAYKDQDDRPGPGCRAHPRTYSGSFASIAHGAIAGGPGQAVVFCYQTGLRPKFDIGKHWVMTRDCRDRSVIWCTEKPAPGELADFGWGGTELVISTVCPGEAGSQKEASRTPCSLAFDPQRLTVDAANRQL